MLIALTVAVLLLNESADKPALLYIKDDKINYMDLSRSKSYEISEAPLDDDYFYKRTGYELAVDMSGMVHAVQPNNRLFYLNTETGSIKDTSRLYRTIENMSLYYLDLGKGAEGAGTKIDSGIWLNSFFQVNADGSKVFYVKGERRTLYVHDLTSGQKLAEGVYIFEMNDSGDAVVYTKEGGELFYRSLLADKEMKIDDNAHSFRVSRDFSKVYYVKGGSYYVYTVDDGEDMLVSGIYWASPAALDGSFYFTLRTFREARLIEYVIDDLPASEAGRLRENLNSHTYSEVIESLYYYDGNREVEIADNVSNISLSSAASAFVVYERYNIPELKLSEISSYYNVINRIEASKKQSGEMYVAIKEDVMPIEQKHASHYAASPSESTLYFLDEYSVDEGYGTLMEMDISGQTPSAPVKIDDEVEHYRFRPHSDSVLYFKNMNESYGDLYERGKLIDTAVSLHINHLQGGANADELVYLANYDKGYGELKQYNGKDKVNIADAVSSFEWLSDQQIVYIADYNGSQYAGDMYVYNKSGTSSRVDSDVAGLISIGPNSVIGRFARDTFTLSYRYGLWGGGHFNHLDHVSDRKWYFDLTNYGLRNTGP